MKFTCEKTLFSNALTMTARAVSARSTMPVLEGVLITAEEDKLSIKGYNLETAVITELGADIKENGSIVVPAKILVDIIRKFPDGVVEFESGSDFIVGISCGMSEFKIIGVDSEQFPKLPDVNKESSFEISQSLLKSMLSKVLYAVAVNENKGVHTGVLFKLENKILELVALDGFRMALRREEVESDRNLSFVAPSSALRELEYALKDAEDKTITIDVGQRHIQFITEDVTIMSRLLDGEFLNYRNSIPTSQNFTLSVNTRDILESVERVSLLVSDKVKNPIRMVFEDGNILINLNTSLGSAKDSCSCEGSADSLEIGFNHKYLIDAFKAALPDEKISMKLNSALSPCVITPEDNDSYLFMVLPVRLGKA